MVGTGPVTEFPVPHGVDTAVTYPELRLLQRYAHEAGTVLEIGTLYGFTCIGMALAGAHVTSVDPHYEGRDPRKPDTWEEFLRNCRRHDVAFASLPYRRDYEAPIWTVPDCAHGTILAWRMAIEDWQRNCLGNYQLWGVTPFGLVFVDGNHIWPCPRRDILIGLKHLCAPYYIAVHDVTPNWGGVWRAVTELTEDGTLVKLDQVGTMAVYRGEPQKASQR